MNVQIKLPVLLPVAVTFISGVKGAAGVREHRRREGAQPQGDDGAAGVTARSGLVCRWRQHIVNHCVSDVLRQDAV